MDFKESQTKQNLMRAFAGESQAANRYLYGAELAKAQKLHVIEAVFKFTMQQERQHARVFYDLLKDAAGEEITIDGSYPVEEYSDIKTVLENAHNNEMHEYDTVYKSFGEIAKQEGFNTAAAKFNMIAEVEKFHGQRFEYFLKLIESDMLSEADENGAWMCLKCGHIHFGNAAPGQCPVCGASQGYFLRAELVPFGGQYGRSGRDD